MKLIKFKSFVKYDTYGHAKYGDVFINPEKILSVVDLLNGTNDVIENNPALNKAIITLEGGEELRVVDSADDVAHEIYVSSI